VHGLRYADTAAQPMRVASERRPRSCVQLDLMRHAQTQVISTDEA